MTELRYVCSLTEKSIKKAKKELNEDPKERLGALKALTEWIEQQPWLKAPTDPLFLLPFLRWGKFSQLRARERLTNLMQALDNQINYMKGLDPGDPKILELVRHGVYLILPGTDKKGRRVIMARLGAADLKKHSSDEYAQYTIPIFLLALYSCEETQVNGLTILSDYSGVTMKSISMVGMERIRQYSEAFSKGYPGRTKGLEFYNCGPVFTTSIAMVKPFLSEKMRNRVRVHETMVSIYDQFDPSILPEEYLPDDYNGPTAGTVSEIAEKNIQEFFLDPKKREFVKDLYSGKYGTDLTKKPKHTETMASFRKLNVS